MASDYSDVATVLTPSAYPMPGGAFETLCDYEAATKVYYKSRSDTFHADKRCPRLLSTAKPDHGDFTSRDRVLHLQIRPLVRVLTEWTDPVKACSHCTQPMQELVRTAVQTDGLPASQLCVFERGERRVTTTISTSGDEPTVSTSETVIE